MQLYESPLPRNSIVYDRSVCTRLPELRFPLQQSKKHAQRTVAPLIIIALCVREKQRPILFLRLETAELLAKMYIMKKSILERSSERP